MNDHPLVGATELEFAMADNHDAFEGRLQRIEKMHRQLASGYVLHVQDDGLIVARPRRARATIPVRGIVLFIAGFLLFKGVLIASLGQVTYDDRVTALAGGSLLERAGAWVMLADPISRDIGGFLAPAFR